MPLLHITRFLFADDIALMIRRGRRNWLWRLFYWLARKPILVLREDKFFWDDFMDKV